MINLGAGQGWRASVIVWHKTPFANGTLAPSPGKNKDVTMRYR